MPKIFISYRRADSQYVTDSIYDHMIRHFGEEEVFLDVGSIPFGVDFREYLRDQIASHDVILVVIGTDWAKIMQERAGQSNDFVRIEIENALAMNKLLIPVLVKNTEMPNFSQLPASISDLQWRNSAIIRRQPDLTSDCKRLADGIKQYLESQGKPNIRTQLKSILPAPFDLIDIPAGKVTLLNDWDSNENVYLKKDQPQTFDVPAFSIAKYPVTNAQFAKFIEAGGYDNDKWWTDGGWKRRKIENWTQPRYWDDDKWNEADYPVVGVSWYESLAFCNWLGDKVSENISLPTEQQWQRAAQGDDNRTYPWGNDWNRTKCNNNVETGIGKTTSVMHYEGEGNSPFDVVDMAGNVWEWCLTEYHYMDNNINSKEFKALRGGSWYFNAPANFRCLRRFRDYPLNWFDYGGFRFAPSHTYS